MRTRFLLLACLAALSFLISGCTLPLFQTPQPTPFVFPTIPQVTPQPSPTPVIPTMDLLLPSPTATVQGAPTATNIPATPTITPNPSLPYIILPGVPSGPYAVIGVANWDVLNIRTAPEPDGVIIGSFPPSTTAILRTGPSAWIEPDLWVEIQKPTGGTGWVNSEYLTEYVAPSAFCADTQVTTLLWTLGNALRTSDGELLSSLVSPAHGVDVYLWRNGKVINFDQTAFNWVFISTWEHNWGAAPGSGLNEVGSFHVVVLPRLLEVYNANFSQTCNDPGNAAVFSQEPWPQEYANVNFYNLHKPGTPGVDLDWRTWLVGVEYVQGKPYLFALIHFQWEP